MDQLDLRAVVLFLDPEFINCILQLLQLLLPLSSVHCLVADVFGDRVEDALVAVCLGANLSLDEFWQVLRDDRLRSEMRHDMRETTGSASRPKGGHEHNDMRGRPAGI